MSDRQLLEDAARAAGIKLVWLEGRPFYADSKLGNEWNPLKDSGQALELAVKLAALRPCAIFCVSIIQMRDGRGLASAEFFSRDGAGNTAVEPDPMAATRLAIVRAAAEIVKGMA